MLTSGLGAQPGTVLPGVLVAHALPGSTIVRRHICRARTHEWRDDEALFESAVMAFLPPGTHSTASLAPAVPMALRLGA